MPKVFISHSYQDRDFVDREITPLLRNHGIETWYSTDDIRAATEWERSILEGLKGCNWFLVVMSPRSVTSKWVKREVHWAMENRDEKRIVPVLLETCDPTDLHFALPTVQHVDFRLDAKKAKSKLLAIFGKKYESGFLDSYGEGGGTWGASINRARDSLSTRLTDRGGKFWLGAGCVLLGLLLISAALIWGHRSHATVTNQPVKKAPPALLPSTFKFDVPTVDATGNLKKHQWQAFYVTQDIGGGVKMELVKIPGGTFPMGTSDGEIRQIIDSLRAINPSLDEAEEISVQGYPQHLVTVPDFYMGKFEATQAQWQAVANLPKVKIALIPDPSNFKGKDRPVEMVSWYEAEEFCARLSKATGREFRLPTEAEWEYACRARTQTPYAFGEKILSSLANFDGSESSYGLASAGPFKMETTPVGEMKVANEFGLYDMHGNVSEWCLDEWHENYGGAPNDGSAWVGGSPKYRVTRGGSWDSDALHCRSAYHNWGEPSVLGAHDFIGFRVVMVGPKT